MQDFLSLTRIIRLFLTLCSRSSGPSLLYVMEFTYKHLLQYDSRVSSYNVLHVNHRQQVLSHVIDIIFYTVNMRLDHIFSCFIFLSHLIMRCVLVSLSWWTSWPAASRNMVPLTAVTKLLSLNCWDIFILAKQWRILEGVAFFILIYIFVQVIRTS